MQFSAAGRRLAFALLIAVPLTGCQTWHSSSLLSGLTASKGERLVLQQAKNDPFPTPSQVGMTAQE